MQAGGAGMAPLVARVRAHAASLEDDLRREIDGAKDERTLVRFSQPVSATQPLPRGIGSLGRAHCPMKG